MKTYVPVRFRSVTNALRNDAEPALFELSTRFQVQSTSPWAGSVEARLTQRSTSLRDRSVIQLGEKNHERVARREGVVDSCATRKAESVIGSAAVQGSGGIRG